MAQAKTWALVSDGVRARIVRGLDGPSSDAPPELIFKSRAAHMKAVLADRSIRGARGSGPAPVARQDPILADMRDFARCLLGLLLSRFQSGALRRLALFASPRMLRALREEMPAGLQDAVILERACNLVGLSVSDLRDEVYAILERHRATEPGHGPTRDA